MARRNVNPSFADVSQITVNNLMQRVLAATLPRYTCDQWQEMLIAPSDLDLLTRVEAITDRLFKSSRFTTQMTHSPEGGEDVVYSVALRSRASSFHEVHRKLQLPLNFEVKEQIVEHYDAGIDAAVTFFAVKQACSFASNDGQLAKLWPQLATLCEMQFSGVARAARSAASRCRLPEPPVNLTKLINFASHQLAMAALLDMPYDDEFKSFCRLDIKTLNERDVFRLEDYPSHQIAPRMLD